MTESPRFQHEITSSELTRFLGCYSDKEQKIDAYIGHSKEDDSLCIFSVFYWEVNKEIDRSYLSIRHLLESENRGHLHNFWIFALYRARELGYLT